MQCLVCDIQTDRQAICIIDIHILEISPATRDIISSVIVRVCLALWDNLGVVGCDSHTFGGIGLMLIIPELFNIRISHFIGIILR